MHCIDMGPIPSSVQNRYDLTLRYHPLVTIDRKVIFQDRSFSVLVRTIATGNLDSGEYYEAK